MRKRVWCILFVFVSALFMSCDKDDVADDVSDNIVEENYFIGTWESIHSVVYKTGGTEILWGCPYDPRLLYNFESDYEVPAIPCGDSGFGFVFQDNGTAKLQGRVYNSLDVWGYYISKTGKYTVIGNKIEFRDEQNKPITICDEPINIEFDKNDSTLCVSVVDKMLAQEMIGSHGVELWGDTAKYTLEIHFRKNYKPNTGFWLWLHWDQY